MRLTSIWCTPCALLIVVFSLSSCSSGAGSGSVEPATTTSSAGNQSTTTSATASATGRASVKSDTAATTTEVEGASMAPLNAASGVTRYVNPTNAAAQDAGEGTLTVPFKTISYAIKQLSPGDLLLIGAGTYRETIDFRNATKLVNAWTANATSPLTRMSAMSGATVIIRGSDVVSGWEWVRKNVFVKRNWTVNSQQVFFDGTPLKQVAGTIFNGFPTQAGNPYASILSGSGGIWPGRVSGDANSLVDKSFYYDAANSALYIRVPYDTLSGHTVEVSTRTYSIFAGGAHDLMLTDLRVEHSNTTATMQNGAITMSGVRLTIDRVIVKYADGAGMDITGDSSIIRNSTATYCGQVGIKFRGLNSQLVDSQVSYNNTRGFNKWWEAGGAKFVGSGGLRNSTVANNRAYFNNGDGLWFDYLNSGNTIRSNLVGYNSGMGIHYEASSSAQIYRNRVFSNSQRGIYAPNSSSTVIAHNMIINNGLEGIAIVDERNAVLTNNLVLIPSNNYVVGNVLGWNNGSAIVLPGEGEPTSSDANLYLGSASPVFSLGWPSATNAAYTGIPSWLTASSHDINSWYVQLTEPSSVVTGLQQKMIPMDFFAIDSIAAQYTLPISLLPTPVPSIVTTRPGP